MDQWDEVLRGLADDPDSYEREGGTVLLTRHGDDLALSLTEMASAGLCVRHEAGLVPISTFIQRNILELPRLARQIVTVSDRPSRTKLISFVEGPATVEIGGGTQEWRRAAEQLKMSLLESEPGTTRLLELMAPAGRGKTMLLEAISRDYAIQYRPEMHPTPLLLKVDLLGRYVGTIDDAIAGSLNNEYFFPGLSQKDVALSVRLRWLVLALDGFDELVARVGPRDAFLRITELLDQLEGQGTIILSARESFFELYQISTAIRTYLQPKKGTYATAVMKLNRWQDAQGVEVFQKLGSDDPSAAFRQLSSAFAGDADLIYHPFFLTRLAQLWMQGERFEDAAASSGLARTRYVIETFVDREAREKWVDRDNNPLISTIAHIHLLAGVAEEMWRSGAFALDPEELRLAGQLGVAHLSLSSHGLDAALARLPTHAALTTKDRKGTSFLHDRFLYYFLGVRIVHLLHEGDVDALRHLLSGRDLIPEVTRWVVWGWHNTAGALGGAIETLDTVLGDAADSTLRANISELAAGLCDRHDGEAVALRALEFVGESCRERLYKRLRFQQCKFWHADLSGSTFDDCEFDGCEFGDVRLDDATSFRGCHLRSSAVASLDSGQDHLFAPTDIERELERRGVTFDDQGMPSAIPAPRTVAKDHMRAVLGLIAASTKTYDVAVEELEEYCPRAAVREVVRIGLDTGALKEVTKSTAGPRKTFVRFAVDRQKLREGARGAVGDPRIDNFWVLVEKR